MLKIRASSLPGFNHCMRKEIATEFPELLGDGFEIPGFNKIGVYKPFGIGMKSAINTMLKNKIAGNKERLDPTEIALEEYEKEFEKYNEIIFDTGTTNKENGKLQISRIVKIFAKDILPRMSFPKNAKPEDHIEVKIEKPIKQGFKLSGRLSVITETSIVNIQNSKTAKPVHTQSGAYGLLLGKENFDKLYLQNFPRTTLKKEYPGTQIVEFDKMFSMGEAWSTINRVISCIESFKKKRQPHCFPANPTSFLCSHKYCKCFGTSFCGYHKG